MSNVAFNTHCSIFPQRWKGCQLGSGVFNPVYGVFIDSGTGDTNSSTSIGCGPPFSFGAPGNTTTSRLYFPTTELTSGDITASQITARTTPPAPPPQFPMMHSYTEFNLPVGTYQVQWHAVISYVNLFDSTDTVHLINPNVMFGILARPTGGNPTVVSGTTRQAELQINTLFADGVPPQIDALGNGIAFGNVILEVTNASMNYSIAYLDGGDSSKPSNVISFGTLQNPALPVVTYFNRNSVSFTNI